MNSSSGGYCASSQVTSKIGASAAFAFGGVRAERVVLGDLAAQRVAEVPGEQLGVAERVGDAVAGDRVAVVAGVADERPPGAGGLEHVVRQPGGGPDRRRDPGAAHALRRATAPRSRSTPTNVSGSRSLPSGDDRLGAADPDVGLAAVRREHAGERAQGRCGTRSLRRRGRRRRCRRASRWAAARRAPSHRRCGRCVSGRRRRRRRRRRGCVGCSRRGRGRSRRRRGRPRRSASR